MLQQTQVATVKDYFLRFMQAFPDTQALAQADDDAVMHQWSGLGYYNRARNLHKAAKQLIADGFSEPPSDQGYLESLPGIGRSTAAAIVAQAYDQPAAILDGNVKRVLSRYHAVDGQPNSAAVLKKLWQYAEQHTPAKHAADYTQAIMDLGSMLCTRTKPACELCPLQADCQGLKSAAPEQYPNKKKKKPRPQKESYMVIALNSEGDQVLLEKRPPSGIWGGLWSFPEVDQLADLERVLGASVEVETEAEPFLHRFSHYDFLIRPVLVSLNNPKNCVMEASARVWYNTRSAPPGGLPQPVQRILNHLPSLRQGHIEA